MYVKSILIVGDWRFQQYEAAIFQALQELGIEVQKFAWNTYFNPRPGPLAAISKIILRVQNKLLAGPRFSTLNRDFVRHVLHLKPDAVFINRGSHISPSSLRKIRRALPKVILVGYNNDDPFAPGQPRRQWRHFLACLPLCDLMLAYRQRNIEEYQSAGAKRVELLRSWFSPERHFPVTLTNDEKERYACDVVFVGHYEDDQRLACLEEIQRRGWQLRIFGPSQGWNSILRKSRVLSNHVPVNPVFGDEYNKALVGAKLALCFLSKLNRDTYTRRCFEIPAAGTVMVSEYTEDLASLFEEDEEAVFFKSTDEMCAAIEKLLTQDTRRKAIAAAGMRRVRKDGHDVQSRLELVLGWIEEIAEARACEHEQIDVN